MPTHDPPPTQPTHTVDSRSTARTRVTHRTIAAQLGVSQSTVSLVLNGKAAGRVAPQLQAAIERTARELGYQPHAAARTLRLGQSRVLALLVPQIDNPFFAPVYLGAERAARTHNYTMVLVHVEEQRDTQEHILQTLATHAVDGFVVWRVPTLAHLAALRGRLVLADDDDPLLPSVQFALRDGVQQAVDHLHALGHTCIAALAAAVDHATFRERQAALMQALAAIGHTRAITAYAPLDLANARAAAHALLQTTPRPTAILCDDDLLAIGVYHAAFDAGLAIPNDLSVVSMGGTALTQVVVPTLTAVVLPAADLGAQAVTLLLAHLHGHTPANVVLPTQLHLGSSTAVARS